MAVVLIEGFDHETSAEVTAKGWTGGGINAMGSGRFGGQAVGLRNNAITKALPSSYSTIFVGCAMQWPSQGQTGDSLRLQAGATNTLRLSVSAANVLRILNSGGTVIASGTTTILANTWYYIEIKLFVNGASGTVEVHLNGATEIASTVGNFGSSNIDTVGLNSPYTTANLPYDDLYLADTSGSAPRNTFLGDVRIKTIYPNGAGNYTQWTPDSGSNYTRVNEAQADGDTSYVSDSTVGHRDSYTFDDIDSGATVFGVQTNIYARKDDAATRQIAPFIRQSGTDYDGSTVTLASGYSFYSQIYNQDPTSADWTASTVNGDEFGVKEIA